MEYLRDHKGIPIFRKNPLDVRDGNISSDTSTVSGETVTFITGAAGFSRIVELDKKPVMGKRGSRIGSYWRSPENFVDGSDYFLYKKNGGIKPIVTGVIETATLATITIHNSVINLELLFETPSGTKDYVLLIRDQSGNTLHGWIGGILTSGDDYTCSIFSSPSSATQSWVGDISIFDTTEILTYEIYFYDTSFSWGTGTILTQEMMYDPARSDEDQLRDFSNGDFAIDYRFGRILYKKATTGTSDTATYKVSSPTTSSSSSSSRYAVLIDEDSDNSLTYIGWALPGVSSASAVWRIARIDESSDPEFVLEWADGNDEFDNIFDNRASLSYS